MSRRMPPPVYPHLSSQPHLLSSIPLPCLRLAGGSLGSAITTKDNKVAMAPTAKSLALARVLQAPRRARRITSTYTCFLSHCVRRARAG